jgi:hypothetical protein
MGSYVYSTRKPTREVLMDGIVPVTIGTFEYAYKPVRTYPGDGHHAANTRRVGRVASQSHKAAAHHIKVTGVRHFAMGGIVDGAPVYKVQGDLVPSYFYDDSFGGLHADVVGRLYKVGRIWTIEKKCPQHHLTMGGIVDGEPFEICTRCDYQRRSVLFA